MFCFYLMTLETQVISPEAIRQKSLSGAGRSWSMKLLFLKGRCTVRQGFIPCCVGVNHPELEKTVAWNYLRKEEAEE